MSADDEQATGGGYIEAARADLVRGSSWTLVASLFSIPVTLGANIVLARCLGSAGLGRFATYTAIFAVVSALANLGWSEATVQWLAAATARERAAERVELIRRCTGFHLFIAGPLTAGCALVLLWSAHPVAALVAAVAVLVTETLGTSTVINTATARNALSAQIAIVATSATQAGLLTAALASHDSATTWAVQAALLTLGPALAIGRLAPEERRAMLRPKLTFRPVSGFWVYALSACLGGLVATLVFGRSEVLVLRANGLLAAAGVFTVITGLAAQMTGPLDSLLAPLTPVAAGLVAVDRARAVRVFRRALRLTGITGAVAVCLLMPVGVVLIRPLYGAQFAGVGLEFAALALVSCSQTVLGPLSAFAFATRSAAQVLMINLLCLLFDAAIAIGLVPLIGLWGAVAANGAAQALSLFCMTRLVAGKLDIRIGSLLPSLVFFLLAAIMGGADSVLCSQLVGAGRVLVIPACLVTLALLRIALAIWPTLALSQADADQLSRAGGSRTMGFVLRALALCGLIRQRAAAR